MKILGRNEFTLTICLLIVLNVHCADNDNSPVARYVEDIINFSMVGRRSSPLYPKTSSFQNETFDFIIVGASPSGAVIANRLSKISNWKILLLEAGDEPSSLTDVPIVCSALQFSKYDWGYRTERQEGLCRGCFNKTLNWPHGKALGGSTVINFMIHIRGNPLDYDKWAAMGNPGWSYEDVFPYFVKSEDSKVALEDTEYRGKGGYLTVSDIPYRTGAADAFVEAAQEAGYPYVDYNGKQQLGISYVQGTIRNGRRCSAEKAFLRPIRRRPNIKIMMNAHVTKVLIDSNKNAYGVRYYRNGKYYNAFSRREVILSAGSLNSPQLLMLSGIGPRKHLEDLGIPVVQDLPVGEKMYDHPTFPALRFQLNQDIVVDIRQAMNISAYADYLYNGRGAFTLIGGVEALTYVKLPSSQESRSIPDMEFMFIGGALSGDVGLVFRRMFNFPMDTYDKFWRPLEGLPICQILPVLLHGSSYGWIKLRSKDPFDPPMYYANYLSDPQNNDLRIFIEGIREVQRIMLSPAMQKFGAKLVDIPLPGCEDHIFNSDSYWECSLKTIIGSLFHQVYACKMGPPDDPEAVVNPRLQVYGVGNLRVADVSIMPVTPSAHSMGPAYMIGEKAADIIKEDWL